jgi:hypothetical protein
MGPNGKKPVADGSIYHIFRELPDRDIYGYKTHDSKKGQHWVDDFKFGFTQLDNECVVHGFSQTQNETAFDNYNDYCNVYNVLHGSGIHFEEGTLDDCKYAPKDPRICGQSHNSQPHCEISVLFEHSCHTAYTEIDKNLKEMHEGGTHPAPDGKNYYVKTEKPDEEVTGYNTKKYGAGTYVDDFIFKFTKITEDQCSIHGYSESYNKTVTNDHDANFCNLYNTFSGSNLVFSDPVVTDCVHAPKKADIERTCKIFSKEDKTVKLPFIQ